MEMQVCLDGLMFFFGAAFFVLLPKIHSLSRNIGVSVISISQLEEYIVYMTLVYGQTRAL